MPTIREAYTAKDLLMGREKLHVVVVGSDEFRIKDERITGEADTDTRGWQTYTYTEASTTFGTLPTPA
jgi:hypothetical protein